MNLCKSYQSLILLLFLFGMHFLMPTPGGYGLYLPFNAVTWLFVALIIGLGLWYVAQQKVIRFTRFHIISFAALLLLCLPMFYPTLHSDFAIPRLIGLAAGLLFLLCIYQFELTKSQHLGLLVIILAGIAIQSGVGLVQVFIPQLAAILPIVPSSKQPSGVFLQTNVMSSFMATGVALSIYLLGQPLLHSKRLVYRYLLFFCLFSCCFSLYYIQSKTGIYGAIIAVVFLLPYLFKSKITSKRKSLFLAVTLIILGGVSGDYVKQSRATDSAKPLFEATDVRSDIFKVGLMMIKDQPIAGYGYGGFAKEYREYHLAQKQLNPELAKPLKNLDHPHNEILLWGIEGGIVALLGLGLLALAYLSLLYKVSIIKSLSLIALISPILLHTQTEYPFYHSAVHWLVFLLLINFTIFSSQAITDKKPLAIDLPGVFIPRFFALFIAVSGSAFMLTTLQTTYYVHQFEADGSKDRNILLKASNLIVWRKHIEQTVNSQNLLFAVSNGDAKGITEYITWGLAYVAHTPSEKVYNNMVLAMQALHEMEADYDEQQGINLILDAMRLFPERKTWGKLND